MHGKSTDSATRGHCICSSDVQIQVETSVHAYAESYLLFVRRVVRVDEDDAAAGSADGAVAPAFVFGRLAAGGAADDDDAEATDAAASLAAATGATNLNIPI